MLVFELIYVLFLLVFHVTDCQRRITDGVEVEGGRRYAVYLLKASISPQLYVGWVCGGALVSSEYIVTSAACVSDVIHLYAIAGYSKYKSDEELYSDECINEIKKKVVLLCTPKAYELKYEQLEKWSYIDIAVVKVESPYDFQEENFPAACSYAPAPILINYDEKYQEPGVDAIVFGWGHKEKWREQGDVQDNNQDTLNYAATLIQSKEECKKEYEVHHGMEEIIDKYMICTLEQGNINDKGESITTPVPTAQGCEYQHYKLKGRQGESCENAGKPAEDTILLENSRKDISVVKKAGVKNTLNADISSNPDSNINQSVNHNRRLNTRRHGICQNDHGGPLVTWIGAHEVLIGVASVFKITEEFDCIGPYLYASTQCNGAFLDCILKNDPNQIEQNRREFCDSPPSKKGFELIEKHISWKDHPDGPADNERNNTSTTMNTSTTNPFTDGVKVEILGNGHSTPKTNLINTTITNIILANKKNVEEKHSNYTAHLMEANINIAKNRTLEDKYLNHTKNNVNYTISNQTSNSIILNKTIDSVISKQIMNTTIFILNLITHTTSDSPTNTTISTNLNANVTKEATTTDAINTHSTMLITDITTHPVNTTTTKYIKSPTTMR